MRRSFKKLLWLVASFLLAVCVFFFTHNSVAQTDDGEALLDGDLLYVVSATDPAVIRQVRGEVTNEVQGVVAEPVDSFAWDGEGVTPVSGVAQLVVDPVSNMGELVATWTDQYGDWVLRQSTFALPPMPTGLRIAESADNTRLIEDDPVTTNVYLHGNTGAATPAVLPTLFSYVATWGPADVTLNEQPFENPFDGPAPQWATHTMTISGVYGGDNTVRTESGDIYNAEQPAVGMSNPDDIEFQIIFGDAPGPETKNFPPPLSFAYHLNFENVALEIVNRGME
ncbi:MAG: hypothetical protein ACFB8W_02035 [Elainellaceae cyanobacterium]